MTAPELIGASVKALLLPPTSPLLAAAVGLVLLSRRPRLARWLIAGGLTVLWLLSLPICAYALVVWFARAEPVDLGQARAAQAIVVLGGGIRRNAPEYGGPTLGRLTLERVRYAARLARQFELPVLVTGGPPDEFAEAPLMRDALEREFGVKVRWIEDRSRNTHENAQLSAAILRPEGVQTIVLVGHAFDMPRARLEFEHAGLQVVLAPTYVPGRSIDPKLAHFLPSTAALELSRYTIYEMLGLAVRPLRYWLAPGGLLHH
jgi:uncharacterized SAM-binding protein YcdF (DUF218 family)